MSNPERSKRHQIVIVGGGAGGLELATKLGDKLGRKQQADITLIDAALTHLWKPLLHEVAAGTMNSYEDELSYLAQAHWHHFYFRLGRVGDLDRERRVVSTEPTLDEDGNVFIPSREFHYDTLVFAVGSETNDFGVEGVREHCHFIDRRNQADAFHQHLLRCFYKAHTRTTDLRPGQLGIAIAGAGATGVELAAELHDATHQLATFGLDGVNPDEDIQISILEAAERVLPALPERLTDQVTNQLHKLGVDVLTSERIVKATAEGFHTESGHFIPAEIKVWAAGIKAPQFLAEIDGLETNRVNQLAVERTLQTTRDENIFAIGDCAACPQDDGEFVPPRAQAAHQQAATLVKTIRRRLQNEPPLKYTYVDYGSLINLSRYTAVGNLMGGITRKWTGSVVIEGLMARLMYFSLYKMHQLALHGAARVIMTTIANVLTRRAKPRMKLH
ncbi:NADH dehydrogenase [Methylohalomonas lacus]|uniref:NADH dehydrogenase n=1 Tax=Methylohalomonas lacus TaxID=398773 RepID=A0AAE3L127_9GAMM|nr:NAD(P)/FAD-dependent oxidoreductase [Methylohalomonas lacus]MCS3902546.1 NADH dehydrogenase [Methylohalomonas lacus]